MRYVFNLYAPDAGETPNTPILRVDNEHAPTGVKAPFDHWHPPKCGPGGKPISTDVEVPLKSALAKIPLFFIEKA